MPILEISFQLALAVGWPTDKVQVLGNKVLVPNENHRSGGRGTVLREFCYADTDVAWAVAAVFDAFPRASKGSRQKAKGLWYACPHQRQDLIRYAETPAAASALAVVAFVAYTKRKTRNERRPKALLVE